MINRYYIRPRHRRKILKFFFILLLITIIVFSFAYYTGKAVTPIVESMGEAQVRAITISAINNAIQMVIEDQLDYKEFVDITFDENNDVAMIQLNFVKINRLARDLANMSEANIHTVNSQTIDIPLGAFTGSALLAAYGPPIQVGLLPIGSVLCNYVSSFQEVGINQTIHRLYIDIETVICIVLPLSELPLKINMMVLIVENIIVGNIPETYIRANTQLDALDLVP